MGFPSTPISFSCPIEVITNLPLSIKELLTAFNASKVYIRPFFQNMPWKVNMPLLIRPHHILFKVNTPELKQQFITGTFTASIQCKVGIFSSECKVSIDTTPPNTLSTPLTFTSHPSGSGVGYNYTLCSPGGIGVISNIDYTNTYNFYTIVVTTFNGNITPDSEWYICPTCLLNVEDFKRILSITANTSIKTIYDLINVLQVEKFSIATMLAELFKLNV
jgi:hypothetical protein